jgi:rhomboid family GlyGly-CTERM serine protease
MKAVVRAKKFFGSRSARAILDRSRRRGRGFILLLALIMVGLQTSPEAQRLLQYDRTCIQDGWRFLTCHFVHWSWVHMVYDVGTFVGLSWMINDKRKLFHVIMFSCLAGSLALYLFNDGMTLYRGISGVNYAILAMLLMRRIRLQQGKARWIGMACLGCICIKSIYQIFTSQAMVQTCLPTGVAIIGVVHLAGILVGVFLGSVKPNPHLIGRILI